MIKAINKDVAIGARDEGVEYHLCRGIVKVIPSSARLEKVWVARGEGVNISHAVESSV